MERGFLSWLTGGGNFVQWSFVDMSPVLTVGFLFAK